ncbi:MAG: hypothetical protein Q8Q09_26145 [Deltaproteobacteria bacterium]|nr:hypothetical protein [Deltaproteobacteria bacterium]
MKRARKSGPSGKSNEDAPLTPFGQVLPSMPLWQEAVGDRDASAFKTWSMTAHFNQNELLEHPKFGRGVVVFVQGPRIEVLFQDGKKMLGHSA